MLTICKPSILYSFESKQRRRKKDKNRQQIHRGLHEVMLKLDGFNIKKKTMITYDDDQIFVGRDELQVRSISHCAMLEEDPMHMGTEADVSAHVLNTNGKKTRLKVLPDTGAALSVTPIETWR